MAYGKMPSLSLSLSLSLSAIGLFLLAASCLSASAGSEGMWIGPFEALGNGSSYLDVGAGIFNRRKDSRDYFLAGRIELRIGKKVACIGPAVGAVASKEGFRYGYVGIYSDIAYGKFVLTPLLAMGIHRKGEFIKLGGPMEFRESLAIAYRLTDRWRVGVSVAHVSNAHLYRNNPGQEDFLITSAIGF